MNRRSFSGNATLEGAGLAASSVLAAPSAGGANREVNSPLLRSMKGKIRMHKPAAILCLAVVGFIVSAGVLPAETWTVESPNGKLLLKVTDQPALSISADLNGKNAVPASPVGITLKEAGKFPGDTHCTGRTTAKIDETYAMPVGKRSMCRNNANQLTLDFANDKGGKFSLILRAYNEGIAYRYRIHGSGEDTVVEEQSGFNIPAASKSWFANYSKVYESLYSEHDNFASYANDIQVPMLFCTPGKIWILITEADLDGTYSGARLKVADAATGLVAYKLQDQPVSVLPWTTPWRVAFVVDNLNALVESTLITDLAKPSMISDTSWIKPGTAIFPWLTGPNTNNMSLERMKQFVDLASEMGWPWIEFDNALALKDKWGCPPEKWMDCPWFPELTAYAAKKNVNVYGWDHWCNLDTPEKIEKYLAWYPKNGFKGIKVDFLDSDNQRVGKFRDDIARACAERKMLLSYHGDITPRGLQRTWPNIATHEGVLGQEYFIYSRIRPTPAYHVNLVFTRNVPGSMDYTPTAYFEKRTYSRAHDSVLPVVFESGWQAMGFNPENVVSNPAREFLKNLPAAWDDIRFIDGEPGKFAVVARRKGSDWWIAGINADAPREIELKLDFLKEGIYQTTLYHDGKPATPGVGAKDLPFVADPVEVNAGRPLTVQMPAGGGFGMVLKDSAKK